MTAPGGDFRAPSSFGCSRGFGVTHGARRGTISVDDEAAGAGAGGAADEALQPYGSGLLLLECLRLRVKDVDAGRRPGVGVRSPADFL